jgi:thioredoxin reductase (NADPH)
MSSDNRTTRATAATRPVLFIVDADPQDRAVTESALTRRFGPDYQVLAAGTPQGGLDAQHRLADHGGDVALVAADLHLPGIDGVEFLERAHVLHPDSWRVLLVAMDRYHTRVPFTELAALQRAAALGRIDFSIVKGWVTPEEWLYHRSRRRCPHGRSATGPAMWCIASSASSGPLAAMNCVTH